jgi:choline dehydrogenase-like flavoprotein
VIRIAKAALANTGKSVELLDFRQLSQTLFDADVCIVGAGPAGLAIVRELADTPCRVLLIETGGSEPSSLTLDLDRTENVGAPRVTDSTLVRARAFGGTSSVWNGRCGPLDASDLEPRDWVRLSGWPLSHAELKPYFARAAGQLGLCAVDYDATLEARQPYPSPLAPSGEGALRPYLWQFSVDEHDSSVAMRCARSMRELDPANLTVLLHATVTELLPDASGKFIESLEIRSLTGKLAKVRARVIVLCAGGIETPRLLLASRRIVPTGVGNEHGLVGRYLMDHARCSLGQLRMPEAERLRPAFSLQRIDAEGRPRYFLRGLALSAACQQREQLLGIAGWIHETEAADDPWSALKRLSHARQHDSTLRDLGTLARQPWLTLQQLRRKLLQRQPVLRKLASVELMCDVEQDPDPDSRITLSEASDELGMPRARIDWRITELQKQTIVRFAQHASHALADMGQRLSMAEHIRHGQHGQIDVAQLRDVAHPSGTTRMADSALRGVVDASGQVHGVERLYIAGTSVFPTQGHVNPTLSLVALAIRVADQIKARHFTQKRSAPQVQLAAAAQTS